MKKIIALAASAALCLAAAPAQAKLTWLAAGDSYSSGEGLPHATGTCARAMPGSGSLAWAYVGWQQLGGDSSAYSAPNLVACTGEKTTQFFSGEWTKPMGQANLVTFTFGGDDVDFAPVIKQCVKASCPSDASLRALIAKDIGPATGPPGEEKYRTFLEQVAKRVVSPGGNVVVLGYPELIEDPRYWTGLSRRFRVCEGISEKDAYELRGLAGDLNATIGSDVRYVNAEHLRGVKLTFVDVNTGGSAGISQSDPNLFEPSQGARHLLCSGDSWMNGLTHIDAHIHGLKGSFHPKQAGQDAMGALAAEVISRFPTPTEGGIGRCWTYSGRSSGHRLSPPERNCKATLPLAVTTYSDGVLAGPNGPNVLLKLRAGQLVHITIQLLAPAAQTVGGETSFLLEGVALDPWVLVGYTRSGPVRVHAVGSWGSGGGQFKLIPEPRSRDNSVCVAGTDPFPPSAELPWPWPGENCALYQNTAIGYATRSGYYLLNNGSLGGIFRWRGYPHTPPNLTARITLR